MSEKDILQKAFRHLRQRGEIVVPPGHDCAVIRTGKGECLAATADQLIEGVHYKADSAPAKIAIKLLRRNLSDIAACGAEPFFALATVALSSSNNTAAAEKWFDGFFRALGRESAKWKVSVCGGDIAKIAKKKGTSVLTMSLFGKISDGKFCVRGGAKSGDILFCTGEFGNSFKSGHHMNFTPRVREGRFLAGKWTRTMIDVSDGLLRDASRLAEASGKGLVVFTDKIPRRRGAAALKSALGDGEDYELLFAVSERRAERLIKEWPFKTRLSRIGYFTSDKSGIFSAAGDNLREKFGMGYDHFE
jgi:thiamine-monophosphate kinase